MQILGYIAAALSTISFVPQVLKTWRTKSAGDVSMPMFSIYSCGALLWIIYGFYLSSPPVYLSNIVVLTLSVLQICLKIKYDRAKKSAIEGSAV